ncbi:UDP-N-acetylmuramoyl-L-alanyl-D-glutamate--2,6-diaminopimelate ligase [Egibacter rhizosphaerae]|uniref:UDP-N-acetylmuramoyl-L-alanyl-D-glutamate--2, 6-diaminopimelate ligase n=1 Tax=Egibacter rhizosphaerae TaxID=1670831 RepID=UPI00197ACE79|nr:UDP-N-acetylmuramoyl-L-alanyl-D-glutamate--2,6-diaminopimelate ligase [Egibacter rhizosphaerae]
MSAKLPALAELAARVGGEVVGDDRVTIGDLTHDSRQAGPGTAFACRPGATADGHEFAGRAVTQGTPALVVERVLDQPAPQLRVPSVADALGELAATVHGDPSHELRVLGITGTNGKTTTAYLLEAALVQAGCTPGLVGTVETRVRGHPVPGLRTTPEATDLQRLLRRMADDGVDSVAMEVSSHGLSLGRVRGTRFAAVGFTNLSQDHLDFHADMEAYYRAKAALFDPAYAPTGAVCVDDPYGRRLAEEATIPVVRVSRDAPEQVRASGVELRPDGTRFRAWLGEASFDVTLRLPGPFNVTNALLALAIADGAGVDPAAAALGIAGITGVAGRMERVDEGQPFSVLVDYAHTPDSVAGVLEAARAFAPGTVIGVLGCGGDRDRAKRPLMGRALVAGSDYAILTSDNPRSEDPRAILEAMAEGAREVAGHAWEIEPDRRAAIAKALEHAGPGDVVVIAGKGHEVGQEVEGVVAPFDDRAVAREILAGESPSCEERSGEGQ